MTGNPGLTAQLIAGKITRLAGAMLSDGVACNFRIGGIPCRAYAALAMRIVGARGYPGHEIEVTGHLEDCGNKRIFNVETLALRD